MHADSPTILARGFTLLAELVARHPHLDLRLIENTEPYALTELRA